MREYLKLARKKRGYTQQQVAGQLGVTRQYYNYIENDKRQKSIDLAMLTRLSQVLQLPLEQMIAQEMGRVSDAMPDEVSLGAQIIR